MSERDPNTTESTAPKSLEQLAIELAELDPRPVTNFTPDNLDEVMEDFLEGRISSPATATYSILDQIDFEQREDEYARILQEILAHPDAPEKHRHVYESYVQRAIDINELMNQAVRYRKAENAHDKAEAEQAFTKLNKELYGDVNPDIARAMIKEVIDDTASVDDPKVLQKRQEFINLLPAELKEFEGIPIKLKLSQETVELMKRCVKLIYTPLLRPADRLIANLAEEEQVEEKDLKLSPQAIAVIFQAIIDEEFPTSGWRVVIKSAAAIHIDTTTKTVVVPENRLPVTPNKLRGLVVHELGVHMVRSIIGEGSDLFPLRFGLSGYGDAEEGLATVMESVISDEGDRTGYQHYLTATLLGMGMEFKDAFEIMNRYKSLDSYLDKPSEKPKKQDKTTFKFMFRSVRGTNELPWHTTLSYFNGKNRILDFIETHKDDPDLITLLFMGKIDPTNPGHLWGALDAKGKIN